LVWIGNGVCVCFVGDWWGNLWVLCVRLGVSVDVQVRSGRCSCQSRKSEVVSFISVLVRLQMANKGHAKHMVTDHGHFIQGGGYARPGALH